MELMTNVERMTMPMFTKLLTTKMVASSFLGLSRRLRTRLFSSPSAFNSSMSEGLRLKKATSDPEIRAEQAISSNITPNRESDSKSTGNKVMPMAEFNNKLYSSGSSNGVS
jgi:hypothetical protein